MGSGWSNDIPNPLIIGGVGVSGEIDVYDNSNRLVGKWDANSLKIINAANPPALIEIGLTVDRTFISMNPGPSTIFPGTAYDGAYFQSTLAGAPNDDPYVTLQSPCQTGTSASYLNLVGDGPATSNHADIFARTINLGSNETFVGTNILHLGYVGSSIGFFQAAGTTRKTVVGSRGGNAALNSLLTALAAYNLIVNNTTP